MHIITYDFETFYDRAFSLSKMTTEEYIRDELFEVIGIAVKVDDRETQWFSGPMRDTKKWLQQFPWDNAVAVAHNAMFDAAILNWHFDIRPKRIVDTLSMLRALDGPDAGNSLAKAAERYGLGVKGTEVVNALGKGRLDFTAEELARYAEYCINDVELTYELFKRLMVGFPLLELKLIDLTIRMFSEPVLHLDGDVLRDHLLDVQLKKEALMSKLNYDKADLMSNPKLAELLEFHDVTVPLKISPTTGKETFAFAKNDEAFKALLEHGNPQVQAIVAARLGIKSTLEETRTERFIKIAERGTLPIPLRYYAAHTGRWGGDDKVNMQNLPRKSPLKKAIQAPEGYTFIDCDSSQIEARTLAWLAGQDDLVDAFDRGEDVYKVMASAIYDKSIEEVTKDERFVGKTTILGCFGPETKVLTDKGWKPIVEVHATDMLWDGEEWVRHEGVIPQGEKEVLTAYGLTATLDHAILTERGWREWYGVATDPSLFRSAISRATWKSSAGNSTITTWEGLQGGTPWSVASAGGKAAWTGTISRQGALRGATPAQKVRQARAVSSTGATRQSYLTSSIGSAYSTVSQAVSGAAITLGLAYMRTMVGEVSSYTSRGVRTGRPFSVISYRSMVGMRRNVTSTVSTTVKGMNPVTYGSPRAAKTPATAAKSASSKQRSMTYDIAYAGPRNRYMVATDAGPIIVHNCGYGMGPVKFQAQLLTFGVAMELEECKRIIAVYRETYPMIPQLWREAGEALDAIANNQTAPLGRAGVLSVCGADGIKLPNGLRLSYPNLRWVQNDNKPEMVYDQKKGKSVIPTRIYGGKCLAADTEVLTERGWVPIIGVHPHERVWDGVEWVNHGGLTYQGKKPTTIINGVRMTPDHEVLTERGWRCASSCEGLRRADFRMPDGSEIRGDQWSAFDVGIPLQVRDGNDTDSYRRGEICSTRGNPLMRLYGWGKKQITRYVKTSSVLGVEVNEGSLWAAHASGMAQLRRSGYYGMSKMEGFLRSLLGGYGSYVYAGAYARPEGQQRELHPGELPLGNIGSAGSEHTFCITSRLEESGSDDGHTSLDTAVSVAPEPVFDLLNAGPRSRFVVRGSTGPFIVHNCVENVCQALARIVIGEQMLMVARRLRVVMTVHDAVGAIAPVEEADEARTFVEQCMRIRPKWALGLPLNCESKMGASYGG